MQKLFSTLTLSKIRTIVVYLRWTPRPVIVTIMDNKDFIRVLIYSYYTTITGWGVKPKPQTLTSGGPPKVYLSSMTTVLLGARLTMKGLVIINHLQQPQFKVLGFRVPNFDIPWS